MKRIITFLVGVILFFASLWGGAYLMHIYPQGTWQGFPVFFTTLVLCLAGAVLAFYASLEMKR